MTRSHSSSSITIDTAGSSPAPTGNEAIEEEEAAMAEIECELWVPRESYR